MDSTLHSLCRLFYRKMYPLFTGRQASQNFLISDSGPSLRLKTNALLLNLRLLAPSSRHHFGISLRMHYTSGQVRINFERLLLVRFLTISFSTLLRKLLIWVSNSVCLHRNFTSPLADEFWYVKFLCSSVVKGIHS